MAERKRLGDVLMEAGLIDEFQLQSALSHQRNWKGKLGSILVELGFIKESDLARILSEILRIPHVNLFSPEISKETIRLIKADIAKKHGVIPVKVEGRVLTLAMPDPMDIEVLDEVRFITGLAVKPALAMQAEIRDAIKKYYDKEVVHHQEAPTIQEKLQAASSQMEIIRDIPGPAISQHAPQAPPPIQEKLQTASSQREIIRDIPGPATSQHAPQASPQAATERAPDKQEQVTVKELLESLISLLIEKDLITREELAEMIKHKKIGL